VILLHHSLVHSVKVGLRDIAFYLNCCKSRLIHPELYVNRAASKNGGKKVLAVSDEEGTVSLLDAEQKPEGHGESLLSDVLRLLIIVTNTQ
jgi:hypothetical protein